MNTIANGITCCVAAGNDAQDVDFVSPAHVPDAITVGGVDSADHWYASSNFGSELDLLAPAVGIVSCSNGSDTGIATKTGTSMAAPHVTGAAALYLDSHPTATPAQVASALVSAATTGAVVGVPGGTVNRLPYASGVFSGSCGSTFAFTIAPQDCASIDNVIVDGISKGPITSWTFSSVGGNHDIRATFLEAPATIQASANPGGTIYPSGAVPVTCGEDQTFTISVDAGATFRDVRVDGQSVGRVTSYTFHDVTGPHTIQAYFSFGTPAATPVQLAWLVALLGGCGVWSIARGRRPSGAIRRE
jgi:hypothetical protein